MIFLLTVSLFWLSWVFSEPLSTLEIRQPLYLNTLRPWLSTIRLLEMGNVGRINYSDVYMWMVHRFWGLGLTQLPNRYECDHWISYLSTYCIRFLTCKIKNEKYQPHRVVTKLIEDKLFKPCGSIPGI